MARLQLNKSSLARQTAELQTFQRFLPSLDLKRQQLMAERAKAVRAKAEVLQSIAELRKQVAQGLPMLANDDISLTGLVTVSKVEIVEENLVGTKLPALSSMAFEEKPYPRLAKPYWVDRVVVLLKKRLELEVQAKLAERRVALLDRAVDVITQRVNLFDKVLIPQARSNIKRIKIYLSEQQQSAIVRSKIAKGKHAAERAA